MKKKTRNKIESSARLALGAARCINLEKMETIHCIEHRDVAIGAGQCRNNNSTSASEQQAPFDSLAKRVFVHSLAGVLLPFSKVIYLCFSSFLFDCSSAFVSYILCKMVVFVRRLSTNVTQVRACVSAKETFLFLRLARELLSRISFSFAREMEFNCRMHHDEWNSMNETNKNHHEKEIKAAQSPHHIEALE